jgi:hypothetical protein
MNKFDYYFEFHQMRLDDPVFAEQYDAHEFEIWYQDFYMMLEQEQERLNTYES